MSGHLSQPELRHNGFELGNPLRVAALPYRDRYAMDRTDAYTDRPDGYSRGIAASD